MERRIWLASEKINLRGMPVDLDGLRHAQRLVDDITLQYEAEVQEVTGGTLQNATNNHALCQWLSDVTGDNVLSVAKDKVTAMLEQEQEQRDDVRRVLEIRQIVGKSAVKKFKALEDRASADGRIRGSSIYCGAASTGRWASIGVNLQNMYRPTIKDPSTLADNLEHMTAADLSFLYGDPIGALCSCVRGMLCAPNGREFRVADWSSIESRYTAYHAGEDWKLDVFVGDGLIYERSAADIYQVDYTEIGDGSERQAGKVVDLACGFQGGMGAVMTMAGSYGIDMDAIELTLPEEMRRHVSAVKLDVEDPEKSWWPNKITRGQAFAEFCKRRWREANPNTVSAWAAHQEAALRSIQNPGKAIRTDTATPCAYMTFKNGEYMLCKLPSGRTIPYVRPHVGEGKFGDEVRYSGLNSTTRQWVKKKTYGGDLFQSFVQGSCRDFLGRALVQLEDEGFHTVGHVHDEILVEQDVDDTVHSLDRLKEIMTTIPLWAPDFPIATDDGYGERRYKK